MRAVFANKRAAYLLDHEGTLIDLTMPPCSAVPPIGRLRFAKSGQLLGAWFTHLQLLYPMWPNETFKLRIRQGNERASAEVHV